MPARTRRLGFIRHARDLGFPMDDIRELLRLADAAPEAPCAGAGDDICAEDTWLRYAKGWRGCARWKRNSPA